MTTELGLNRVVLIKQWVQFFTHLKCLLVSFVGVCIDIVLNINKLMPVKLNLGHELEWESRVYNDSSCTTIGCT